MSGEYHTGKEKAPETTTPLPLGDRKDDQVDGPKAVLETPGTKSTNTEPGEGESDFSEISI